MFALDAIADPVSLFEPIYHDGGEAIYVMDQVKDTKNVDENWLENIALSEAMKHLDEREKHILNLRFFSKPYTNGGCGRNRYIAGTSFQT